MEQVRKLVQGADGAIWILFFAGILAAWAALFAIVRDGAAALPSGLPAGFWASLCLPADSAPFAALFAMWALMAAAMMLPGLVPALRTFLDLRMAGAPGRGTGLSLIAGFLAVWLAYALGAAALQGWLARQGLLTPDGAAAGLLLPAGMLLVAGAYQFSPLKEACLSKCRAPLSFFLQHWKPGHSAAAVMGARLGGACLGCCWALMALGFAGGTMNLLWMGAATLFMTLEKLPEIGRPLTRPLGIALMGWGAGLGLGAVL